MSLILSVCLMIVHISSFVSFCEFTLLVTLKMPSSSLSLCVHIASSSSEIWLSHREKLVEAWCGGRKRCRPVHSGVWVRPVCLGDWVDEIISTLISERKQFNYLSLPLISICNSSRYWVVAGRSLMKWGCQYKGSSVCKDTGSDVHKCSLLLKWEDPTSNSHCILSQLTCYLSLLLYHCLIEVIDYFLFRSLW